MKAVIQVCIRPLHLDSGGFAVAFCVCALVSSVSALASRLIPPRVGISAVAILSNLRISEASAKIAVNKSILPHALMPEDVLLAPGWAQDVFSNMRRLSGTQVVQRSAAEQDRCVFALMLFTGLFASYRSRPRTSTICAPALGAVISIWAAVTSSGQPTSQGQAKHGYTQTFAVAGILLLIAVVLGLYSVFLGVRAASIESFINAATHVSVLEQQQLGIGKYEHMPSNVARTALDQPEASQQSSANVHARSQSRAKRDNRRLEIIKGRAALAKTRRVVSAAGRGSLALAEGTALSIGDDAAATAVAGRLYSTVGGYDIVRSNQCVLLGRRPVDGRAHSVQGPSDLHESGTVESHDYRRSLRQGSGMEVRWVDCSQRIGSDPEVLAARARQVLRDVIAFALAAPLRETCSLLSQVCLRARKSLKEEQKLFPKLSEAFLLGDESVPQTVGDTSSDHFGKSPRQVGLYFVRKALPEVAALFADKRRFFVTEEGASGATTRLHPSEVLRDRVLSNVANSSKSGPTSLWTMRSRLVAVCVPPSAKMFEGYCIHRLLTLAQDRRFSMFMGDGGGARRGHRWSDDLPTDAELSMHAFFNLLDHHFSSVAEEYDLAVSLPRSEQGQLFSDAFVVSPQSIDQGTIRDRKLPLLEVRHSRPLDVVVRFNGRIFVLADPIHPTPAGSTDRGRRSDREVLFRAIGLFLSLAQVSLGIDGKSGEHGFTPNQLHERSQGQGKINMAGLGTRSIARAGRRAISRGRRRDSRGRSAMGGGAIGSKLAGTAARRRAGLGVTDLPMQHGVRCAVDLDQDVEYLRACLMPLEGLMSGHTESVMRHRPSLGTNSPLGFTNDRDADWEVFM